jgi:hypothetical protein
MLQTHALAAFAVSDPELLSSIVFVGDPYVERPQGILTSPVSLFDRMSRLACPRVKIPSEEPTVDTERWPVINSHKFRLLGLQKRLSARSDDCLSILCSEPPNPGFSSNYQFVDISGTEDSKEREPAPCEFQNLAEAEMSVSVYMYMVLLNYPADSIAIVTPYQAQKFLIIDVFHSRFCALSKPLPLPAFVGTPDELLACGSNQDYILVSLVRTLTGDDYDDYRRDAFMIAKAQRGLYVFGDASCYLKHPLWGALLEPNRNRRNRLELRFGKKQYFGSSSSIVASKKEDKINKVENSESDETFTVSNPRDMSVVVSHLLYQTPIMNVGTMAESA